MNLNENEPIMMPMLADQHNNEMRSPNYNGRNEGQQLESRGFGTQQYHPHQAPLQQQNYNHDHQTLVQQDTA
jgi:hypothetical protein